MRRGGGPGTGAPVAVGVGVPVADRATAAGDGQGDETTAAAEGVGVGGIAGVARVEGQRAGAGAADRAGETNQVIDAIGGEGGQAAVDVELPAVDCQTTAVADGNAIHVQRVGDVVIEYRPGVERERAGGER